MLGTGRGQSPSLSGNGAFDMTLHVASERLPAKHQGPGRRCRAQAPAEADRTFSATSASSPPSFFSPASVTTALSVGSG